MSKTRNSVYIPSYGKDETKFKRIPEFEKYSNAPRFKEVIPSFKMTGKVGDFVWEHHLAIHCFGSDYNGYGYSTQNRLFLLRPKDAKILTKMLRERKAKKRKRISPDEKKAAWCRRLAKLTGISLEKAEAIANEKLNAKIEQINDLMERQDTWGYSIKREKLMLQIQRSNPLRRIKDSNHAFAILAASVRHNESDYDDMLEEAREMAARGRIDRSEVKDYARTHTTYWGDVESSFFSDSEGENGAGGNGDTVELVP